MRFIAIEAGWSWEQQTSSYHKSMNSMWLYWQQPGRRTLRTNHLGRNQLCTGKCLYLHEQTCHKSQSVCPLRCMEYHRKNEFMYERESRRKKISGRTYPDSTYGLSFNHSVYMNMRNSVSHVNFEQTDVETCEMFWAVETIDGIFFYKCKFTPSFTPSFTFLQILKFRQN